LEAVFLLKFFNFKGLEEVWHCDTLFPILISVGKLFLLDTDMAF